MALVTFLAFRRIPIKGGLRSLLSFQVSSMLYLFIYLFIYFYLAVPNLSCSMWDLILQPWIEPVPPALGAQSPNHWTTQQSQQYAFEERNSARTQAT